MGRSDGQAWTGDGVLARVQQPGKVRINQKRLRKVWKLKGRFSRLGKLRSFHPNRTCTQILVKVCTLVIQ